MSMTDSDWAGIEIQRRHDMGECLDNPGGVCPICEDEMNEQDDFRDTEIEAMRRKSDEKA